jgi:tight adherence protein C
VTYAILTFILVSGLTGVTAYVLLRLFPTVGRERLGTASQAAPASILRFEQGPRAGWQRIFERLGQRVTPSDTNKIVQTREKLLAAGYQDPRAPIIFYGARVGLGLLLPALYVLYGLVTPNAAANAPLMVAVFAAIGFFAPSFWLSNRIKERQRAITNALPDVLDLLMVCVEAGMGFDAAVARIADAPPHRRNALHDELMRMHLETRAGRPRDEALRELGERVGVQEVKSIVSAFIQTEKLGTPLGRTLRVHAEAARVSRRHRAEERAYVAPLKMVLPIVFFLMPSFFLVAMGPPLLMLMRLFEAMGGLRTP